MKWLAIGCGLLGAVACGGLPPFNPTTSASSSGSSTGAPTTGGASSAAASSGSASGGSTTGNAATSAGSTTGPATSSGGTSTGGQGSSTGGNGTTSGSYIGLPCTFNAQTGADSCAPYGYLCSTEIDTADPPTCILPQELYLCNPSVGCQDGGKPALSCISGFTDTQGQTVSACAYPCKTLNDCHTSYDTCIDAIGACVNDTCTNFYGTCDLEDGGPKGQCLPVGSGTGEVGLCFQTGFDFLNTGCNLDPNAREGAFSQCQAGGYCLRDWDTLAGPGDGGECLPLTPDGGCPVGEQPLPLNGADWAICLQECDSNPVDGVCPDICCADGNTCLSDSSTGVQLCFPSTSGL